VAERQPNLPVSVVGEGGGAVVHVAAADAGMAVGKAAVWLVRFAERESVPVAAGENAGRTLIYHHVVRDIRRIGWYRGAAAAYPLGELTIGEGEGCAVLVQRGEVGPILGAAVVERHRPGS